MQPAMIVAPSVSRALAHGLTVMQNPEALREESRNGGVTVWNGPVVTKYTNPLRRVLFSPMRNANPFFHLFESFWMLDGRNDLPWVAQFNKQMASYSDDGGKTQPAAYGHRWRHHFGYDQIVPLVTELRNNPGTRRAVLTMWDGGHQSEFAGYSGNGDLMRMVTDSSDIPCNTQCFFTVRDGKLYMGVTCRSNDILWGAHGANAVHFSILLEYMAAMCGLAVGELIQFSWNYHLYDGILKNTADEVIHELLSGDYYFNPTGLRALESPIFDESTMRDFHHELPIFLDWLDPSLEGRDGRPELEHPFLNNTALPMYDAWIAWKCQDIPLALEYCEDIVGEDWKLASTEWMQRKLEKQ